MKLFDSTLLNLERTLNYSTMKNKLVANNISNVDTPYFKAKDVSFKSILSKELNKNHHARKTHEKHLDFSSLNHNPYIIYQRNNTTYNHNGNNVDIDREMAELAKNQIYYQGLIDRVNGKFNKIQTVLRGGS